MRMPLLRVLLSASLSIGAWSLQAAAAPATVAAPAVPPASAPGADLDIPAALRDWRGWVLKGTEYRACPFIATRAPGDASTYLCAWPGKLSINADEHGAAISEHWRVDAPGWVPLPGNAQYWPQELSVNGQRVPLLEHANVPAVWLTAGNYDLRAHITWSERPQVLPVPDAIALIELSVDGKAVAAPQRDDSGVALGRAASTVTEADSLNLQVFRLIEDSIPAQQTTRLILTVGGSAREIDLGVPLAPDFVPLALNGDLPARLDSTSHLHVQLRPGVWTVNLLARALAPLKSVTAPSIAAPWPTQEIWSYYAVSTLRITNPVGTLPIDPGQAGVPREWRMLPAFALSGGGVLQIEERSRGPAPDEANRLQLTREAWLDFSGAGISTKDELTGTLVRDWRLDVAAPYVLRRAESQLGGNAEGLLITRGSSAERSGVEWNRTRVQLSAATRIEQPGLSLPVNGWQQNLDAVTMMLHLPFGYRLLGAPGADAVSGSWASHWRLLDAFLVALIVLFAWRLLGLLGGVAAALYLVLGYQEIGAPFWTLAAVLVIALIRRALPVGRLQRALMVLSRVALLLLLLTVLPFVATQVRSALYPQLENSPDLFTSVSGGVFGNYNATYRHRQSRDGTLDESRLAQEQMQESAETDATTSASDEPASVPAAPAPVAAPPRMAMKAMKGPPKLETIEVSGARIPAVGVDSGVAAQSIDYSHVMQRYAENTVIQAGGGEPAWHYGSTARLTWSGPVLPQQSVQLVILPPWLTRLLRLALVVLLGWLSVRLIRGAFTGGAGTRPASRAQAGKLAAALLLGLVLVPQAFAQGAPEANLLNELRNRLTEAPRCAPACAKLASASVIADGARIRIALEAHAGERVALPLPGATHGLVLHSILLDGVAQDALVQREGKSWLTVTRGVHRIELDFGAQQDDKITLNFPLQPAQIDVSATGWQASGVSDARLLTESLDLLRLHAGNQAMDPNGSGEQQFAPFVRLTRDIALDLDWTITNTVQRLAPVTGGFSVELPLLPNETVQTAQLKVREQRITVPLSGDTATWQSQLGRGEQITLTAPALSDHAEIWRVTLSPTWHAEFSGVLEMQPENAAAEGYRTHEFHPLPGETLSVKVTRPEAILGDDGLALDAIALTSSVAQHASEHLLHLSLRSTLGGESEIDLPKSAQVLEVSKDNLAQNLRPRDGKLSLPITPGLQHFLVRWRESDELGQRSATDPVNVHLPAANVQLALNLPQDRWVLFVYGPSTGPAVLYWGQLLLMLLLAYGLTRLPRSPLRYWQWVLLGIGFSTFSWLALVVVVAWLLALQWRAERVTTVDALRFNLGQLALLALSVVALLCLVTAIPYGLLGEPEMQVVGNGSQAHALHWFSDVVADGALPAAGAFTLPLWAYKVAMLAWALWLANALIGWLRWGFAAYSSGGYWRGAPKAAATPVVSAAPVEVLTPEDPA